MPFDYDTANTGVFTRLGKLVKKINAELTRATTTLPADLKEIADLYEAADYTHQIEGLYGAYEGFKQATVGQRQSLASFADRTLLDRDTVLEQLKIVDASMQAVLPALHQQMLDDAKTLKRSVVTVGAVSAGATNQGNGTVLTTKVLDGYNPPLSGGLSTIRYNGLNSELGVPSETMKLECIADSSRDGLTEGSEQFQWIGGLGSQEFDYQDEGSGPGPGVSCANSYRILTDGDFESWGGASNNTPNSWTLGTGTLAGTHIFRESGAGNFHRGTYSAKFLGDGALATIQLEQAIAPSSFNARRMYNVSVRIKASGVPAAGNIVIQFEGTGYAAGASEKIDIAAGAFPTAAFTAAGSLFNFFISMPAIMPSDWKLVVKIGSTLSAGTAVYFDSLTIAEVIYHGGVGIVIPAGSTRFVVGDRFSFAVSNDQAGKFSDFFRQKYKFQLPSSAGGNISDALAT